MANATHLQKIASAITGARATGPRKEVVAIEQLLFAMVLLLVILWITRQ